MLCEVYELLSSFGMITGKREIARYLNVKMLLVSRQQWKFPLGKHFIIVLVAVCQGRNQMHRSSCTHV